MRGHIHKRVRTNAAGKQTTRWYVVVDTGVDQDGRRKQKWHGGFGTRREAEVERARIVNDLHTGGYVAPDRLTLADWVRESWLPMTRTRVKPSTFDSYRSNMETHVLPSLGNRPLQQLTAPMLNTLYSGLLAQGTARGPLAPKTVRYVHTIIHKAISDAVDAGILASNIAARAKPPRPRATRAPRIECWEPAELVTFLEHVRGPPHPVTTGHPTRHGGVGCQLQRRTGCRRSRREPQATRAPDWWRQTLADHAHRPDRR